MSRISPPVSPLSRLFAAVFCSLQLSNQAFGLDPPSAHPSASRNSSTPLAGSQNFPFEVIPAPAGYEEWVSPVILPAPAQDGSQGWGDALARAKRFVSQLTLEEKVNLTTGSGVNGPCVGQTGTIPRLGFNQPICLQDSPTGVRFTDFASYFPAQINVAATFDRNLMRRRGAALGAEFVGKGVNVALAPMTNLMRSPASGRSWEGFGADSFLSSVGSVETILGMQSTGVSACIKHYIGAEQEHYRGGSGSVGASSNIDDRTFQEEYARPFAEAIRVGVDYVMSSYNRINQTWATENSKLINGFLKGDHHFQGVVLSDWTAVVSTVRPALAGLDMNMPGFMEYGQPSETDPSRANSSHWGLRLIEAVRNGSVPISRLDDMVHRIMSTYYKRGQDRESYPRVNFHSFTQGTDAEQSAGNKHVNVQADHYKLIREIGSASTVLLKNLNQTLPLRPPDQLKSIAIFGADAGDNPNGANSCPDRGCDAGTLATGWGSGTADFPYLISPASAITSYIRAINPTISLKLILNDTNHEQITATASQAEISLVHVNADSGESYVHVEGNEGDRNDLKLWHGGDAVILSAAGVCRNTVVIIHSVGPVDMESWIEHPNVTAVIYAGLPGQESGNAEVDILWGKVNPSARLPFTIGKNRSDYPADVLYKTPMKVPQNTYQEGLKIDYRHFDFYNIKPRFEYGFGLSYTTFKYSDIKFKKLEESEQQQHKLIMKKKDQYDHILTISFSIQNVGLKDGHEVSQLYLGYPSQVGEPIRVLRGFDRVFIKSGKTEKVEIQLRVIDISIWDVVGQVWVVPHGKMKIWVGASSRDLRLSLDFTV